MQRRTFISGLGAFWAGVHLHLNGQTSSNGLRLARAARAQIGVTRSYDPNWAQLPYPGGDVPRSTGICSDVVIRAARDGLHLDLQKLVHEDIVQNFDAYPARKKWGSRGPDSSIDHRRVLNLETYWQRIGAQLWQRSEETPLPGDEFPMKLAIGDILTWLLDGRTPHIGIVVSTAPVRIVHNNGKGVEESPYAYFHPHTANGQYRWPVA